MRGADEYALAVPQAPQVLSAVRDLFQCPCHVSCAWRSSPCCCRTHPLPASHLIAALGCFKVTPEPDFSYASFETNVRLPRYDVLVRGVLEVFRPKRFTMTLHGEDSGIEGVKKVGFMHVRMLLYVWNVIRPEFV